MTKISDKRIAAALKEAQGVVADAADKLGVPRHTVERRIKAGGIVGRAFDEARETILDTAEAELGKAVSKGEPWAIRYFLDNRGADRGYGKRETLTVKAGIDLHAKIDESVGEEILERLKRGVADA